MKDKKFKAAMQKSSWQRIKERFGDRCAFCLKQTNKLTRDHLIPRSKGGLTVPENIVPTCEDCNQKKGNKPVWCMIGTKIQYG